MTIAFLLTCYIQGQTVPGQYIISFNNNARRSFEENLNAVEALFAQGNGRNQVLHKFDSVLNGVSARLDKYTLEKVKALPNVDYIEEDSIVRTFATQNKAPWGLARVSQRSKLGYAPYTYNYDEKAGEGVNIYVLDTGVSIGHKDFEGRITWGTTTASQSQGNDDYRGHGTHCAGSAAGATYGVAKKANIVAVKVLRDDGTGYVSETVAGINWVVKNKSGVKGNVISLSLGGGFSESQNKAVNDAVDKGVITIVAAGNNNTDACNSSPSSALKAITVGSVDISDTKAASSNYGPCVDIHGPGVNIKSACIGSKTNACYMSGTSMATPHIAGLAATLLSQGISVRELEAKLKSLATSDVIQGLPADTVNLLGYNGIN
ncbi:subtilisin-like protein [Conidiobolus coronatus NRRL 28638]|uniref:Subtilisin-like protein n=1 Tax=Conidiobolus coronatus (strain ATCC 28846 / CBS 209.66 / NRRL 28638) TaxID=796925 RepID=A0A137P9Z0_CONC2|nr:subtilisin-like protein [Conidiobolus coronatus NRRL 28638]|eukprot:KXN71741.1 subtilisin-like protein [Conidiobolus coronatus NRRL 28638]